MIVEEFIFIKFRIGTELSTPANNVTLHGVQTEVRYLRTKFKFKFLMP